MMRLLMWGVLAMLAILTTGGVSLYLALRPPEPPQPDLRSFVLDGVTVINPTRGRVADASVRVEDGVIQAVGPAGNDGEALREFRGAYVLPGLVDMHAHMPPKTPLGLSAQTTLLFVAHGVTSVRLAGDNTGTGDPAARAVIAAGAPGPRIFTCGPFVVGSHALRWPNSVVLERPQDADRLVAGIKAKGNVCVKSYEDLDAPRLRALAAAAARHGLTMMGHVPHGVDYTGGLVPEVQHYFGVPKPQAMARDHVLERTIDWRSVDEARMQAVVEATLRNHTVNLPTLVATSQLRAYRGYPAALKSRPATLLPRLYGEITWHPERGLPNWKGIGARMDEVDAALAKKRELTHRLYEAGAPLLLGTDAPQPFTAPGLSLQQEMREFVASGIPPEEVWAMATWRAADVLKQPTLGRLAPGAPADLLVFGQDPTRSLDALASLEAVVVRGRLYRRKTLDDAVERWGGHTHDPVFEAVSMPLARSTLKKTVLRNY